MVNKCGAGVVNKKPECPIFLLFGKEYSVGGKHVYRTKGTGSGLAITHSGGGGDCGVGSGGGGAESGTRYTGSGALGFLLNPRNLIPVSKRSGKSATVRITIRFTHRK